MDQIEILREKYKYSSVTPMMQQYLDVKFAHMDSLLLFRMGDFYELFMDDAVKASQTLGIALSKRGKNGEEDVQMCGVPHHALESYLYKLVEEGYKVAICDQLESPQEAKKRGYKAIVRRDVVRIITPGTITEESILNAASPNYLVSVVVNKGGGSAISYLDIGTSEFGVVEVPVEELANQLFALSPKEILISENIQSDNNLHQVFLPYRQKLVYQVDSYFAASKCRKSIENFYKLLTVDSIGELSELKISAIGAIIEYIRITQKNNIPDLPFPKVTDLADYMIIDASTRRNLELVYSLSGGYKNSLLSVINHTITKQGSRLLYKYLSSPLANKEKIDDRLKITDFFFNAPILTENIRQILRATGDLERLISKIALGRAIARDLLGVLKSMEIARDLNEQFILSFGVKYPIYILDIIKHLSPDEELMKTIEDAIKEDAPNQMSDGGFIKPSYHPKLAELSEMIEDNSGLMEKLKLEYQRETGVDNLRICHNNILGLFIEVTPKNASKITDPKFIHRQSIATAVRFTTSKLQKIESDMVNAKTLAISLEQEIFSQICSKVVEKSALLRNIANSISELDLFTSLAFLAMENDYTKPEITEDSSFIIEGGRHVVVERNMPYSKAFVPNNCDLCSDNRLWLITGPNMAGKSTFLRQNALIVILAQIGSFVPARRAKIGVVDKLFSRIGAADDLSRGQSTFMVEMVEVSAILSQSTTRSLIILDEVGRGTSTYDGLSIAWGCLEHIHDKLKCRSLFATHYQELTKLSESLPALRNYTIKINEVDGKVLFLHQILPGSADRSYGIHVAQLAGLPRSVISRAEEILKHLEAGDKADLTVPPPVLNEVVKLSEVEKMLESIDPNDLSPKQALEKIYEMKKKLN
ncbi:MAG: DNA mismatch repair protein MutS [Rickettsiaceae bacterium]|nr:DNA mismatch repair protein MutS [Rickettsiaceae bacterium]